MSFEEKLISVVRVNEVLFDMSHKDFKKTDVKDRVWKEIAIALNSSPNHCKARWRNLRDTYIKCERGSYAPSGSGRSHTKKWKNYDKMVFLKDFMQSQKTSFNTTAEKSSIEECADSNASSSDLAISKPIQSDVPEWHVTYDEFLEDFQRVSIATPPAAEPEIETGRPEKESSINNGSTAHMVNTEHAREKARAEEKETSRLTFYKLLEEKIEAANLPPAAKTDLEHRIINLVYTAISEHLAKNE